MTPSSPAKRPFLQSGAMVVMVVCAVAGGTALTLMRLESAADRSRTVEIRLYEVAARLNGVEANEWQLIAEQRTGSPVEEELTGNLTVAATLIDNLAASLSDLAPVKLRFADYHRALDEELRYLQTGDYAMARTVDVGTTDPAFDTLSDAITERSSNTNVGPSPPIARPVGLARSR